MHFLRKLIEILLTSRTPDTDMVFGCRPEVAIGIVDKWPHTRGQNFILKQGRCNLTLG